MHIGESEEPEDPHGSLYSRGLAWWVDLAIARSGGTLAAVAVATVLLIALSTTLTLDVRWTALLPSDLPAVQEFLRIDSEHESPGALIVVISGAEGAALEQAVDAAVVALKPALCPPSHPSTQCKEEGQGIRRLTAGTPEDFLASSALRILPGEAATGLAYSLSDPGPVAQLGAAAAGLRAVAALSPEELSKQQDPLGARLEGLRGYIEALGGEGDPKLAAQRLQLGSPYMISRDGGMAMVLVTPAISSVDAEALPLLDRQVEDLLAPLGDRFEGVRFERTGLVSIMRDEMDSVGPATAALTLAAMLGVLLLLAWALRSTATALTALAPVCVGALWSLGVFAIFPGQLNMMTSMVLVILIGLGVDFSLHTVGRFDEELRLGRSVREALICAFGETGRAVLTGAATTAMAFYALLSADMDGVREFGFCAGTGVLVTLLATWCLLPPMLVRRAPKLSSHEPRSFSLLGKIAATSAGHPRAVVIAFALLTCLGFAGGRDLGWEYNMMELEPAGLRSIELQNELVDRYGASTSFSQITAADPAESRDLRERFEELPDVAAVDEISLWLSPKDMTAQRAAITLLKAAPQRAGDTVDLTGFAAAATSLADAAKQVAQAADQAGLDLLSKRFAGLPAAKQPSQHRAGELEAASAALAASLSQTDRPVTPDTLPAALLARYRSEESGRYLVQVISAHDTYERDALVSFDAQTSRVDPRITGMAQLILLMNDGTVRDGRRALALAFGFILLVVWLHFRRPLLVLLALLPLLSGLAATLGILALTEQKLNFVSVIGLPIILGIGIDDGVHFLHRVLEEGPGRLSEAALGVGRAIVLTSLTTMIGFGSLAFYLHRGMASMGVLLFIGVGACLVVTVVLLPALCQLFERQLFPDRS